MKFKLQASFKPTGDQPQAIKKLSAGIESNYKHQVLLGVTGSGKTFTIANLIKNTQKPTLVISHNKTLAAQLYQEFRDFFPENAVSYFVSYYDYYQPEAYIPQTDTYIEKETDINREIEKLRLAATMNLSSRRDTIVVSSVSCLYNLGSPTEYGRFILQLEINQIISRINLLHEFVRLGYERSDYDWQRGTFRVRGELIDIFPAYEDFGLRIEIESENKIRNLKIIKPISGKINSQIGNFTIYPAKHYLTDKSTEKKIFDQIKKDLKERIIWFNKRNRLLEAHRLKTKVNYDLEQIKEFGYVNGIENYSRYFDDRKSGEPPFTLLDYFPGDFLTVIDESHMTIPQIRGMYEGDRSRKKNLIDYGFRLPAAIDNRPLKFLEFLSKLNQVIYTSATPETWELKNAHQSTLQASKLIHNGIVEQLIRPTGIIDPKIFIKSTKNRIDDLILQIRKTVKKKQRVLVTTLTKKMAEDLALYLKEKGIKVHHLHSEINTLDRVDILADLRLGTYDVVVGINLLREGLDLPEVSLVAILDADKEGFLRSETSLIQVMGRAARHINGKVIMYADQITGSMSRAIKEVNRRRQIQINYNLEHGINPKTISKPIRKKLIEREKEIENKLIKRKNLFTEITKIDPNQLMPLEKNQLIKRMKKTMHQLAIDLEFELAATLRDKVKELESS